MILVQANNISRSFGDSELYQDVNFNIQTNDRIALVGRNGVGKTTLIKQMLDQEPISTGEFSFAKDIRIGYLEQHVSIDSDLTIWEEMLTVYADVLALRKKAEKAAQLVAELSNQPDQPEYEEALRRYDYLQEQLQTQNAYSVESDIRTVLHGFRFYESDYDTPVASLSGGQKTRLALARILLMKYDLLILDEPTNHLDMETLNWLESYLSNYQGALLIVSHDRYFLNRVANQVIELRNGTAHIYKGNYDYYMEEKALRQLQHQQAYERQQAEIKRQEDFIQKNIARASTTKRAQSRRRQLERMQKIERPRGDQQAARIEFSTKKASGDRVLEAIDLSIGYDEIIAQNIDFDLRRQQAIAIVGPNGVGKTTLLKTLIQEIKPLDGEVIRGSNVSIGYYDQNVNHLDPNLTVLETLWRRHDTTDEWQIRSILGSFLFSGETSEKKVSLLSGGEKARLSLAVLATDHDNTLLLDEPTNHLDIDSKEVLEEALIHFDGTLLFVSHDRYFINRIATQVLEITPEKSTLYLGDYDYYIEKKAEQAEIESLNTEVTPEKAKPQKQDYQQRRALERQLRQMQQTIDQTLKTIDALELEKENLEQLMLEANEAMDTKELHRLHAESLENDEEQLKQMEIWEATSLEMDEFLAKNPEFNR